LSDAQNLNLSSINTIRSQFNQLATVWLIKRQLKKMYLAGRYILGFVR
jgi:hypothetical protein